MMGLLNIPTYFIIHGAIMLSYLFARLALHFPPLKKRISQYHQLMFARFCFIGTIFLFLIAPYLPIEHSFQSAPLELKPVFHQVTHLLNTSKNIVTTQLTQTTRMPFHLSLKEIMVLIWSIGVILFSYHYLRMIIKLKKLQSHAYCQHNIKRIRVSFSSTLNTPCCWSFFRNHFVILPNTLLTTPNEKRLSLRHEFQHIRQKDTYWLQLMQIIRIFFFWNPFLKGWMNWFNELQEFSCDEVIILRRKISPHDYAQCLLNAAKEVIHSSFLINGVIAINGINESILYRRVNMIFTYRKQKKKLALITAYAISALTIGTATLALNSPSFANPLTAQEISTLIQSSDVNKTFKIDVTPEVVKLINQIRNNEKEREHMLSSLERMKKYQPIIQVQLKKQNLPNDLLAIPLVESGFIPLDETKNPVRAAGIWQIIPSTAKRLDLVINDKRDDRLNTELSTQAALNYLTQLYSQFHSWKLAILSYEIGEEETERLIKLTGSRDTWTMVHSSHLSEKYKKHLISFLTMFDAYVIIMHHPSLLSE